MLLPFIMTVTDMFGVCRNGLMSVDIRRSRSLKDQDLRRPAGTLSRREQPAVSSDQESKASDRSDRCENKTTKFLLINFN